MRPPMMGELDGFLPGLIRGGAEHDAPEANSGKHADFASLYCAAHHIQPERFVVAVLRRTLSFRALWLGLPVLLLGSGLFAADRKFLARVGRVETMDRYSEIEERFRRGCGRRSRPRKLFRLRVSTKRLRLLVAEAFAQASRP